MITFQLGWTVARDIPIEESLYVLQVDNPQSRDHLAERVDWDGTVLDLDTLEVDQLESSEE